MRCRIRSACGSLPPKGAGVVVGVAAVWDGGLRLFVDGKLQGQGFLNGRPSSQAVAPQIVLGTDYFGKNFLHGMLDDVRISSAALYRNDFTPKRPLAKTVDTLAIYHCDEGRGEVLHDSSGHEYHGRLQGVSWGRADEFAGKR